MFEIGRLMVCSPVIFFGNFPVSTEIVNPLAINPSKKCFILMEELTWIGGK
jgi:hypothetical protein